MRAAASPDRCPPLPNRPMIHCTSSPITEPGTVSIRIASSHLLRQAARRSSPPLRCRSRQSIPPWCPGVKRSILRRSFSSQRADPGPRHAPAGPSRGKHRRLAEPPATSPTSPRLSAASWSTDLAHRPKRRSVARGDATTSGHPRHPSASSVGSSPVRATIGGGSAAPAERFPSTRATSDRRSRRRAGSPRHPRRVASIAGSTDARG